jgi:DNA-binding MarR family transcriptional regulator
MSAPPPAAAPRPGPGAGESVDDELVRRLRTVVARLNRRLRQEGVGDDTVTVSQLSALFSIERLGAVTLGELAEHERVKPPTMTRIVARLEEAGLVERQTDADDRRCVRVRLTSRGRRLLAASRNRRDAFLADRVAALDPELRGRLPDLVTMLEQLVDAQP